jgi:hypothetical protein
LACREMSAPRLQNVQLRTALNSGQEQAVFTRPIQSLARWVY